MKWDLANLMKQALDKNKKELKKSAEPDIEWGNATHDFVKKNISNHFNNLNKFRVYNGYIISEEEKLILSKLDKRASNWHSVFNELKDKAISSAKPLSRSEVQKKMVEKYNSNHKKLDLYLRQFENGSVAEAIIPSLIKTHKIYFSRNGLKVNTSEIEKAYNPDLVFKILKEHNLNFIKLEYYYKKSLLSIR